MLSNPKEKLIGMVVLFFIFAILPITNFSVVDAPFRALNLGSIDHAKILVKKESCNEISALNPMLCKLNKDLDFGIISDAKILSRIGNVFIISDGIRKYPLRSEEPIPIKTDDVLSWVVIK